MRGSAEEFEAGSDGLTHVNAGTDVVPKLVTGPSGVCSSELTEKEGSRSSLACLSKCRIGNEVDPPSGGAGHVNVGEKSDMNVVVHLHCDPPICGGMKVVGGNAVIDLHYDPPICGDSAKGGEHSAVDLSCDPPICGDSFNKAIKEAVDLHCNPLICGDSLNKESIKAVDLHCNSQHAPHSAIFDSALDQSTIGGIKVRVLQ